MRPVIDHAGASLRGSFFTEVDADAAAAVIPGDRIRARYNKGLNQNRIFNANWFGAAAMETAFTKCDGYVDALNHYLDGNIDYMTEFVNTRLPMLKMKKPEGTYLTWVDFRGTGMSPEEIEKFIIEKAHIATDMGTVFGPGGEGYLRFNLACPRAMVVKAMEQLEQALKKG